MILNVYMETAYTKSVASTNNYTKIPRNYGYIYMLVNWQSKNGIFDIHNVVQDINNSLGTYYTCKMAHGQSRITISRYD